MAAKKPVKKTTKSVGSSKATSKPAKKTPVKKTQKPKEKQLIEKSVIKTGNDETLAYVKEQKQNCTYVTHDGVKLTLREAKFIDEYVATGNGRQSVINAGYSGKSPSMMASRLLNNDVVKAEIDWRLQQRQEYHIATREEIMDFFYKMMKGEILDQFDMPTSNGDKIKAGIELAKRTIDIEDRVRERATQTQAPEIKISLNWEKRNGQEDESTD